MPCGGQLQNTALRLLGGWRLGAMGDEESTLHSISPGGGSNDAESGAAAARSAQSPPLTLSLAVLHGVQVFPPAATDHDD